MTQLLALVILVSYAIGRSVQQECAEGEEYIQVKDIADLRQICEEGRLHVVACLFDGGAGKGGFDVPVNSEVNDGAFTYGCALKDDDIIPYVTSPLGALSRFVKKLYRR